MNKLLVVVPVALLIAGCGQAPTSADGAAIRAHSANWEKLLNEKDLEGLVALYTDDARVLPPNGRMKSGRDAVREEFGAMIDAGLAGELTSIEAKVAGDIGYNVGTYTLRSGAENVDTGKFIETWRRDSDGEWRIANDIWNSDNPAAPATAQRMTHWMGIHEVRDPDVWLAAWRGEDGRRSDFAAHGAPHVHVMQDPDNPRLTGLVIGLEDPAAFDAWLRSEAGASAAAADTVDMSTLVLLEEVE